MEVYIRNIGHDVLSLRRNFPVKTDRWTAAVVAIDQLPRNRERDRHETYPSLLTESTPAIARGE